MIRMRFPVVLFDLDGTLIDSGPMIVASMKHAAKSVLGRDIPEEVLSAAVGGPGLVAQMQALAPDRVDDLVAAYREHNEPLHETLECCVGMEEVLATLQARGHRLGIVTAKRRLTADLAFARLPIEHLFETVVGGDETKDHKPHPAPLLLALERLGAAPEDAAYVGDSPFDMQAAKAAGMHAVGVTWGGIHGREALTAADEIVDTAEELLARL